MNKTDVLVIGGGVAGLSIAIYLAEKRPDIKITILTKTNESETNTSYAQGGVAAVWDLDTDNTEKHFQDTLIAGDGLCDEKIVSIVVNEGPQRIKEIIDWGARFDRNGNGSYDLAKEGGHSAFRILHYKDITGWEIQRTLNQKIREFPNVELLEHYFAINIITQHHLGRNITRLTPDIKCFGAYALNKRNNQIETFSSKITVLATGGAGQVYKNTTNPTIATGDGIAMVYRAKGRVANMEFVQFHPTSLFNPKGENPSFLISEAIRGFGGILKNPKGEEFMKKYDSRESLAPRDIVARAIDHEMKICGSEYMFLDCTHLEKDKFIAHFPNIYNKCLSLGIDPAKDWIPVVPACHYMCGGILIDEWGHTSIERLYAAGECTNSGLHGANRLASNSLLEGLVFGQRVAFDVLKKLDQFEIHPNLPLWDAKGTTDPKELILLTQSLKELKDIMSNYVGIVRSNERLKRALNRLYLIYQETEELYNSSVISPQLCELRNLITIAYLISKSAQMRKESRGLHYTTDYPDKNDYKEITLT